MFWNRDYSTFTDMDKLRQENDKLRQENTDLSVANAELQSKVDALQLQIEEMQKQAQAEAATASMLIDFTNIDVFSVERNVRDNLPNTIIGYWVTDKDGVKSNAEWFLFCSNETHEKIVTAFKKHIAEK